MSSVKGSLGRAQEFVALLAKWNRESGRHMLIHTVEMVSRINELIHRELNPYMPALDDEAFRDVREMRISGDDKQRQQSCPSQKLRPRYHPTTYVIWQNRCLTSG
jgi:hypothetical protein